MQWARYDLNCVLTDAKSGAKVLEFAARQVADYEERAGFVGGGFASSGQTLSIATDRSFRFVPYNQKVYVRELGLEFLLTAWHPYRCKRIGESYGVEDAFEIVLDLE